VLDGLVRGPIFAVAHRVIGEAIASDTSEAEEIRGELAAGGHAQE
jgi:hypothetical protein